MDDPRRTASRRAALSYDQLRRLTKEAGWLWPDLLIKDYQGISQDIAFLADEIDETESVAQQAYNPSVISQVQQLQKQIDGLPEFTCDTTGFTADSTYITTDKVIA